MHRWNACVWICLCAPTFMHVSACMCAHLHMHRFIGLGNICILKRLSSSSSSILVDIKWYLNVVCNSLTITLSIIHVFIDHSYIFFGEICIQIPWLYFHGVVVSFFLFLSHPISISGPSTPERTWLHWNPSGVCDGNSRSESMLSDQLTVAGQLPWEFPRSLGIGKL